MLTEGYKVVRIETLQPSRLMKFLRFIRLKKLNDKIIYKSAYASSNSVVYEKYKWTTPDETAGPLAVFKNISEANDFMIFNLINLPKTNFTMKRCEFEEVPLETGLWYGRYGNCIEPDHSYKNDMRLFPTGTVLAKRVRLL